MHVSYRAWSRVGAAPLAWEECAFCRWSTFSPGTDRARCGWAFHFPTAPARSPHSAKTRAEPVGPRQTVPGVSCSPCQAHGRALPATISAAVTIMLQLHVPLPPRRAQGPPGTLTVQVWKQLTFMPVGGDTCPEPRCLQRSLVGRCPGPGPHRARGPTGGDTGPGWAEHEHSCQQAR